MKNEFALVGLSKLSVLNGKFFRDLEKSVQRRLRAKSLKAICLDRDSQALKYDIFSRLNLGAVKLKDQEVRNCIYRGPFNTMLRRIADTDENVKALFHYADNKRMEFEERILRFFAMRDFYHISGTFKDTMNRFMMKHLHDSPEEIANWKNNIVRLLMPLSRSWEGKLFSFKVNVLVNLTVRCMIQS